MELWKQINEMSAAAEKGWGGTYYHVVPQLIDQYGLKLGAEIGVAYGGHSAAMLQKTNLELLYSIDPYQPDWSGTDGYTLPDGKHFGKEEYEELYLHALHRLQAFGDRSVFLRMGSTAAWATLRRSQLDFVFIDAKHTFEDLYTDIFIWEKQVKKGGWILGHDYGHESYPGVTDAVDCHFSGRVTKFQGYVWGVRKTW